MQSVTTVAAGRSFESLRSRIIASVHSGETPSVAVAVAQGGKIVWQEAFGCADRENRLAATPETLYKVGSLSKSIIATAAMTLVDRGVISLDDSVERIIAPAKLTAFEGKASDLKVKHLLNMTSGIPHGSLGYFDWTNVPHNDKQKNDYVRNVPIIVFPPGEVYEYSNLSIGLLDLVIERASKRPFAEYMRDAVFRPMGMKNTSVWFDDDAKRLAAVPYATIDSPITRRAFLIPPGGLGFMSSAHDLIMFGMFHLKNRQSGQKLILRDEALDLMHTYDRGPQRRHFALGLFNVGGRLVSDGQVGGGTSNLTLIPSQNVAIVVLTNITSRGATANAGQIAHDIAELFDTTSPEESRRGRQAFVQKFATPYRPTPEITGRWEGTIKTYGGDARVTITFAADGVRIKMGEDGEVSLQGISFNAFRELRGHFRGNITTLEPGPDAPTAMTITARLRDGRLYGYVSTSFSTGRGSFMLPAYLSLKKEE